MNVSDLKPYNSNVPSRLGCTKSSILLLKILTAEKSFVLSANIIFPVTCAVTGNCAFVVKDNARKISRYQYFTMAKIMI
jgi:hypothetical protein